jgi:hypothetical protein
MALDLAPQENGNTFVSAVRKQITINSLFTCRLSICMETLNCNFKEKMILCICITQTTFMEQRAIKQTLKESQKWYLKKA